MSAAAAGVGPLGLRLAGPRARLLAGLVFPLVPQIQQYTQEGRSYAMVCALVTWATYVFVACVVRHTRWWWTAYGSTMLLACLLHEFAVLALAAHGITLLVSGRGSRDRFPGSPGPIRCSFWGSWPWLSWAWDVPGVP
ncbi:hypothetical protein [Streptomyces mirabilis]|uniref:hypothetical protein n=1 Tax=Streptomyces mirabilis TaxID=68239 RepID=UPI0036A6266C